MHQTSHLPSDNRPAGVLRTLAERGFLHQCTDEAGLADALNAGPLPVYAGFDATADSLHVGHLLPIMALRQLQRHGHKPIVLLGGGTTRIGDPSFRTDSRPMLSDGQIAANMAGIRKVFERFLTFGDGPTDAVVVNNADWLDRLAYIDLLRTVGPHFSVNRMLSFDSVKGRLERQQNLSFLEFNYMVLQAYDFLELSRRTGCRLQIGGADQWGNIVSGIDLVRRVDGTPVFGWTLPLLTTASGAKMGKTAAGAVWLNADRLSPSEYWQFWRNTEDGDVLRFLRLFTDLPDDEIARLEGLQGGQWNAVKVQLAHAATALAHGEEAAHQAASFASQAFGGQPADATPSLVLAWQQLALGIAVTDLLVTARLASSKAEARRAIQGQGVRWNAQVVEATDARITLADFGGAATAQLSLGRKRHVLVGTDAAPAR